MKKNILSLYLILSMLMALLPTNIYAAEYQPFATENYNGHIYQLFNTKLTWQEAEKYCESIGGHLATITSQEEQNVVEKLAISFGLACWIGGYRELPSKDYQWITGEDFVYTNWTTGAPSYRYNDKDEIQMGIYANDTQTSYAETGKWNDFASTSGTPRGFVCEWENLNLFLNTSECGFYNNHRYYLFNNCSTWIEAKTFCETIGGHLATISSKEENDFLFSYIKSLGYTSAYFGFTDREKEGIWKWVTNEDITYTNWASKEPNSQNSNEDYAMFYWKYSEGQWNDGDFGGSINDRGFICEWDSIHSSQSTSDGAPIITSAEIRYNDNTYDLFNNAVNIQKDSEAEVSVKVNVNENGCNKVNIYLTQGVSDTTSESEDSKQLKNGINRILKPGELFSPNKDIYILALDEETGKSSAIRTKLRIVQAASGDMFPDSGIEGLNFKLGKTIGFTIPENVPFFGDTEIKWDFGFIPISFEYDKNDNNKIHVVFGTNIATTDPDSKTGWKYFKDFDFKKYKENIQKASKKQGRTLKQVRNDFKMTNLNKMSLFGDRVIGGGSGKGDIDFDIAGYAEMKYVNGKWQFVEGMLGVDAEVSYKYEGQLFIWTIPCYYEIGAGIGCGIEGKLINISPTTYEPEFDAFLKAKIEANIGAGIGIAKAATVGASGEGSLNLKAALNRDYKKAWGEGSANFNIKIFGKEVAKKEFAKGEFLIFETGNNSGLIKDNSVTMFSIGIPDTIDISSVYKNEDRSYTTQPESWLAEEPEINLFALDYTNKNTKLIAENIYTETKPMICDIDGTRVMVMQWDNRARADADRTMLVYSIYDENTDTWSAPQPVNDDGTADFYPDFKDGYLVWQNQKTTLDDSLSLEQIGALGEICVSKWNGNGFDEPINLTNNNNLDSQPVVSAVNDSLTVAWVTNTQNDILGLNGKNSILKCDFNGTTWGDTTIIADNLNAIVCISAGNIDSNTVIAYSVDEDNDFTTIEDRDITVYYNNNIKKITNNQIFESNPVIANNMIYYYTEGNIAYTTLDKSETGFIFDEGSPMLTDTFTITSNENSDSAVLWSKSTPTGAEVYATLYRENKWGNEVQLSDIENIAKYPCGVLNSDGSILTAFNVGITNEYNEIIKTDLYTVHVYPSFDLELSDFYFDESEMTAYITVKNNGELEISNFDVQLIDKGTINESISITEPLKPGDSFKTEIKYNKPNDFNKRILTASVSTDIDEYNIQNNSLDFEAGHADIEISDVKADGYDMTVTAKVTNIGYEDAENVVIKLIKDNIDNDEIDEMSINLKASKSQIVEFKIPRTNEYSGSPFYVKAECENETVTINNIDYDHFEYVAPKYENEILSYSINNNILTINSYVKNNTELPINATVYFSIYNKNNILKGVTMQPIKINAYNDTGIDVWINEYTYESGDYIKAFIWGYNLHPLCSYSNMLITTN